MSRNHQVGQRLSYGGALCTVRYIGSVNGTSGAWLGVEWDDPSRGKHDGSHKGTRYFACISRSPTAASFIRPTRPAEEPRSFLEALNEKYASEVTADKIPISSGPQIIISGKVAEEIGFDKIRRQQAQLHELKIVILDGMRVASSTLGRQEESIREVCPKVVELDLSRNLLVNFGVVIEICSQLDGLRGLRVNGNRFQGLLENGAFKDAERTFRNVKELALDETLLSWEEICHIATRFSSLSALFASLNQLSCLSPIPDSNLATSLVSVHLEFNNFKSLYDIANLTSLTSLRNLHLKGNNISSVGSETSGRFSPPVFSSSLQYLDISYNKVSSWSFIDAIPDSFPGLTSLRLAHNPIYDEPAFDATASSSTASISTGAKTTVTEEAYMLTVGRLASLKSLNFSTIVPTDRTNAEMFYLSRIGRQLSSVPEGPEEEAKVISQHHRYAELCELYGEPVVVRRKEVNPAFLEARLVSVTFRFHPRSLRQQTEYGGNSFRSGQDVVEKYAQIPKSFDIYAVKGIAGKLFGHPPLKLRLVWETGEWDPVAGFDEEAGDSSEDEEEALEAEPAKQADGDVKVPDAHHDTDTHLDRMAGKWVKREEELRDSPRQFGFCVDGLDVTIRVEPR